MQNVKNIYDLLIAIIPSCIVAIVSIFTIIYSINNNKKYQVTNFKLEKLEKLYSKLIKVNGNILAEKNGYINIHDYYISQDIIKNIIIKIESLKQECKLYIGLNYIDDYMLHAERFMNCMRKNSNDEKDNLKDGENDTDENDIAFKLFPSTFQNAYNEYDDSFTRFERFIEQIAQNEMGVNKIKIKYEKPKRKTK